MRRFTLIGFFIIGIVSIGLPFAAGADHTINHTIAQLQEQVGFLQAQVSAAATVAKIRVVSPNGGEVFEIGKTYEVRWSLAPLTAKQSVRISLNDTRYPQGFQNGTAVIVSSAPNTGSYMWIVPESLKELSKGKLGGINVYKIRVAIVSGGPGTSDISDAGFSIIPLDPTLPPLPPPPTPLLIFEKLSLPSQTLVNGSIPIYRMSARATSTDVGLTLLQYTVSKSGVDVNKLQLGFYSDSGFSLPVREPITVLSPFITESGNKIDFSEGSTTILTVPAGSARYFDLVGTFDNVVAGASTTVRFGDLALEKLLKPVVASSTGSFAVSLDSSSPGFALATAGSTNVPVSAFRISAAGEAVKITNFALQLSSPVNGFAALPTDVVKVTLWDGATKVGESVFVGDSRTATVALNDFIVPKDASKILSAKVDLARQGVSQPGIPGAIVAIDWDANSSEGTKGIGMSSGVTLFPAAGQDTVTAGARVYRSYPTIQKIGLASNLLVSGRHDIFRFKVTAATDGDVGIAKLAFRIASSSAVGIKDLVDNANIYAFTDSGFSIPVSGLQPDGAISPIDLDLSQVWQSDKTDLELSVKDSFGSASALVIPAGIQGARYLAIRADINLPGGASTTIATALQGDTALSGGATTTPLATYLLSFNGVNVLADNDFIWSPFSTTTVRSINANDYVNGAALPGLPQAGTAEQILLTSGSGSGGGTGSSTPRQANTRVSGLAVAAASLITDLHILDRGKINVRGAKVTEVASSSLRTLLSWGTYNMPWLVLFDAHTIFSRGEVGGSSPWEIKVGDNVNFDGDLVVSEAEGTVRAEHIRDVSNNDLREVRQFGEVKSVNTGERSFTFLTENRGLMTVVTSGDTKFLKGGGAVDFSALKIGDKTTVIGLWEKGTVLINADTVKIHVEERRVFSGGKIKSIGGTTAPTTLVVNFGRFDYTVEIGIDTALLNSRWERAALADFKEGDQVRVYGVADGNTIEASVVRNTSLR